MAAFMVCFYHLSMHYGMLDMGYIKNNIYIPNINRLIVNFCAMSVPLFFMVNGSLVLSKEYGVKKLIKRAIKLMIMYISWIIIISFIASKLRGSLYDFNFIEMIINIGNSDTVHLWYLRTTAILMIITPIIKKISKSKYSYILNIIIMLLIIFPFTYNYLIILFKYLNIDKLNILPRTGLFTMYSILYYILGKIIYDNIEYINKHFNNIKYFAIILILLGWILVTFEVIFWTNINRSLFDGVNSSFPTLGALCMSLGAFILISNIKLVEESKMKNIVQFISSKSMGIYIFHMPMILFLKTQLNIASIPLYLSIITTFIIIVICIFTTYLLNKIPIIRSLLKI